MSADMTDPPVRMRGKVVGVSFVPSYPQNVYELEQAAVQAQLGLAGGSESLPAVLIRNPGNAFDENAVEVHHPGVGMIGHLPREAAARLAPFIDVGLVYRAWIEQVLVHPDYPDKPACVIVVQRVEEDLPDRGV